MDTRRLYYEDHALREFSARVVSCAGCELVLDATAFFPGGGGQESDAGTILEMRVVGVKKREGQIVHLGEGDWELSPGQEVSGRIDWDRRHALMRAHTAEHLLMGELQRRFKAEIEKVAIGPGSGTLFLKGTATWEQIGLAQNAVNAHIRAGIKAHAKEMPASEARLIPGVRISERLDGRDRLRILEIGEIDRAACAGVHLQDTSEIVALLVTRLNSNHGKTLISFSTGWEAVASALDDSLLLSQSAEVVNAAHGDLPRAVAGLSDSSERLLDSLRAALLEAPAIERFGDAELVSRRLDGAPARALGDIAARLSKAGGTSGRIVLLSTATPVPVVALAATGMGKLDCGKIVAEACAASGGKGGGRAELGTGAGADFARLVREVETRLRATLSKNPE